MATRHARSAVSLKTKAREQRSRAGSEEVEEERRFGEGVGPVGEGDEARGVGWGALDGRSRRGVVVVLHGEAEGEVEVLPQRRRDARPAHETAVLKGIDLA